MTMLPCLPGPYAPAASFSSTMRTSPTKLVGDLAHIPINTPIKAICEIWFIFLCIHSVLVIAISVAIVAAIAVAVALVIAVGITVVATVAVAISIAVAVAIANAVTINIPVPIAIPFAIAVTILLRYEKLWYLFYRYLRVSPGTTRKCIFARFC
jgi:hypothetical protein